MGRVVAIDAGTTGVRALVVDERAQVTDMAYREITQHYPRPGWVEHDPAEIWEAVRATLAEVGGRLAEAGETVAAIGITNQRETLVAFDRASGRPLHRAIVWQDRRTADICAELERDGHLPLVRERTGLVLDPYFTATQDQLPLAPRRRSPSPPTRPTSPSAPSTAGCCGTSPGGRKGASSPRTPPTPAAPCCSIRPPSPGPTSSARSSRCPRRRCPPSARRPGGSAGRTCPAWVRPVRCWTGSRSRRVLGDQQAALFGQACFDPGMVKVTYGTGSFVLAHAGPERPAAPDGLTVSVAWDLGSVSGPFAAPATGRAGTGRGGLCARGIDLRLRRRHRMAARPGHH